MAPRNEQLLLVVNNTFDTLRQARKGVHPALEAEQVGRVKTIANGIIWLEGLPDVQLEELVQFPGDVFGIVLNIEAEEVGVVLLDNSTAIEAGAEVRRTGRVADVPVGDSLLGRVINPLGQPLDNKGPIVFSRRMPLEREAPHIMDRSAVEVPLQTGIKVIDALIPIGRGQRQLILGDRQTGKTAIAIDTILNQQGTGIICVYCATGQRGASLANIVDRLSASGALDYTVVMVAEGSDAPGLRFIAPYAATSIAEYFMEQGRDVLIVYDDLTNHAETYREISLLLRRPPGREAFPGDIFYIHSRLLERATRLRTELGGGSLTALPIIQTEAQNISAYIPTNLISITDGQVYLSPNLFQRGILPAVDVGKSVSRIGGKAQLGAYQAVAGALKLAYSQFEELEMFARFGTRLDEQTRNTIGHGQRIRECLKQSQYQTLEVEQQLVVLMALTTGLFDSIELDAMSEAEQVVIDTVPAMPPEIQSRILSGKPFNSDERGVIIKLLEQRLASMEENNEPDVGDAGTENKKRH